MTDHAMALLRVTGLAPTPFTRAGFEARGVLSPEAVVEVHSCELPDGTIAVDLLESFDSLVREFPDATFRRLERVVGAALQFHEDPRGVYVFCRAMPWIAPPTYEALVEDVDVEGFWVARSKAAEGWPGQGSRQD